MEYSMGNDGDQYQTMDAHGMLPPNGQASDFEQEYMQSRSYGSGMQSYDDSRNTQTSSASYGGSGYRSPLRYSRVLKEMNSRNGLNSPAEQRSGHGNGDYYSSLPGIGLSEGQHYSQSPQGGNPYY